MRWVAATFWGSFFTVGLAFGNVLDADWIWIQEGAWEKAPAETVWFRHEVRASEPSTGVIRILADDHFRLWVNGQAIGEGDASRVYRFNLNGIVERGPNIIAVEVRNEGGRAGLLVDGEVRSQGGSSIPFDSGPAWRATRTQPPENWIAPRFDTSGWSPVAVLGKHEASPHAALEYQEGYLDRFDLAPGFQMERVAEKGLVGSVIAITWGNRGRLIVSRERGPIFAISDSNGDGLFDTAVVYSDQVTNCQGLCMVGNDLYAVGLGPKKTGLYRLPDEDGDDQADRVEHITGYEGGIGEHGPHNVVLGPDGSLYHNLGNHAKIRHTPEATSPLPRQYEGDLLQPRYEDANGHAAGIKKPGGTIWRFTPDGQKWWLESAGYRNHYDFAFDRDGELFTFDSDMEWDEGQPWYRPVRVNHATIGSGFGWRSGAAKWPDYYFDSLPTTVDVGRGSPCGVLFYDHVAFPERYRGTFLASDWSMGRMLVVPLKPKGASYEGSFETLVSGNPLNVSDIEIAPDGSLLIATGGRNTEGGIYRVWHESSPPGQYQPKAETLADVLALPQIQSAWARELALGVKESLGEDWTAGLQDKAISGTPDEQVRALTLLAQLGPAPTTDLLCRVAASPDPRPRAFAAFLLGGHSEAIVADTLGTLVHDPHPRVVRRALEAYLRSGIVPPTNRMLDLLRSDDRWLRYHATVALGRVPAEQWRETVMDSEDSRVLTNGLLALYRLDENTVPPADSLAQLGRILPATEDPDRLLDVVRMIQLVLMVEGGRSATEALEPIARNLLARFPTGDGRVDYEIARILAVLQPEGTIDRLIAMVRPEASQADQIHYVLCLRYVTQGWNDEQKRWLVRWYDGTRDWEGGASFVPYLANILTGAFESFSPEDRRAILLGWKSHPYSARLILQRFQPDQIADAAVTVDRVLNEALADPSPAGHEVSGIAVDLLARMPDPAAQASLRRLFDEQPDRREPIARALANHPTPESFDYLVRSLSFGDETTLQLVLKALRGMEQRSEKPADWRAVILAGLKLNRKGGLLAAELLETWTGDKHDGNRDWKQALAFYQNLYAERFPHEPPADLLEADTSKTRYSVAELTNFLEQDPRAAAGDVERGRAVYTKANCIKCHRFGNEGIGVGPDLTTLRKRFQKKEIVEAILLPSAVISDQYRTVTVATTDGLVLTGMPLPQAESGDKLVLLLPDSTKIEIANEDIEESQPSNTSVMPEGLLKDLTLEEIADLFAYLETSQSAEAPATPTAASPTGGE